MITVYEDKAIGLRIKWNQDTAFQVWHGDQEVDYFSVSYRPTLDEAIQYGKEYCDMVAKEMEEAFG